jgi:hypothetical protein
MLQPRAAELGHQNQRLSQRWLGLRKPRSNHANCSKTFLLIRLHAKTEVRTVTEDCRASAKGKLF